MIQTTRYIRKPLYVDAVEVTNENFNDVAEWCQGDIGQDEPSKLMYIHIRVHNPKTTRQTKAYVGDWVLYTNRGYKVYTPKAFGNSFDLVKEAANPNQTVLPDGYGAGEESDE